MNNSVLIGRNIFLTYSFVAKEIYVSSTGEIIIIAKQYSPKAKLPKLSLNYLESICSQYYYGGYNHQNAIADIMLLNSVLRRKHYDDFYQHLQENLDKRRFTLIISQLF